MATDGRHTTIITSDEPIKVVTGEGDGRWFRLFHAVIESGAWARLSPPAAKVYVVLAKHSDTRWIAWPSVTTIMRLAGLKRATVFKVVTELEQERLITRRSGGGRFSTTYQLVEPAPVHDGRPVHSGGRVRSTAVDGTRPQGWTPTRLIEQDSSNSAAALLIEAGVKAKTAADLADLAGQNVQLVTTIIRNADHLTAQGKLKNRTGYIRSGILEKFDLLPELAAADRAVARQREAERQRELRQVSRRAEIEAQAATTQQVKDRLAGMDPAALEAIVQQAVAGMSATARRVIGNDRDVINNRLLRAAVWSIVRDREGVLASG